MAFDLQSILDLRLPASAKGLPIGAGPLRVGDIGAQGWSVLGGDLPMPVAVLKARALASNMATMQAYLARAGVKLAPHGKTTLCPQLFDRQIDSGAWGITVATISQFKLCHDLGVTRVIMANELVGAAEIRGFAQMCAEAPARDYYVLVDSLAGARQIQAGFAAMPEAPPAKVLIEVGQDGGRCGVRHFDDALALAQAIADLDRVDLHGIEGYEGLFVTDDAVADAARVRDYLDVVVGLYRAAKAQGLFADPEQIILSAGGSAYYDLVAQLFGQDLGEGLTPVVRSGCYLTHDSGFYRRLLRQIDARGLLGPGPALHTALEIWTRVISRPEPDLAIVMMGKRDVSFDIDLPTPIFWHRPGLHDRPRAVSGWTIEKLSDQHGFLRLPAGEDLAVGDLIGLDISHPCTTFDKWSLLFEVDDDYRVINGLKTFF